MANTPLQDSYSGEKLQPDDEIVKPQDDLYIISWEVNFHYELFETRKDNCPDTATRLPNHAACGEVNDYVTEDEPSSVHEDKCSSEKKEIDVTENETRPRQANSGDATSPSNESPSTAENEKDVTNESNDEKIVSKRGAPMPIYKRNAPTRERRNGGLFNKCPRKITNMINTRIKQFDKQRKFTKNENGQKYSMYIELLITSVCGLEGFRWRGGYKKNCLLILPRGTFRLLTTTTERRRTNRSEQIG